MDSKVLVPGGTYEVKGEPCLLTEDDLCVDAAGVHRRYTLYSLRTGRRLFGCCPSLEQLQDVLTSYEATP